MLYSALALAALGASGNKFTIATMGANQFSKPDQRATFFNWFLFSMYAGFVASYTAIIYVQDNVSWGLGFGLCAVLGLFGTVVLVSGNLFYHHAKPEGSPFMDLARVVIVAFKKWSLPLSSIPEDYHYNYRGTGLGSVVTMPSKRLSFFNRAALKTDVAKPSSSWSDLCTVQQVEDLKAIIRVIPIWSTAILLSTPIAVLGSTAVLQALVMDRHLGPYFKIPAGTVPVLTVISGGSSVALINRVLNPLWLKITTCLVSKNPPPVKPLKRVGLGHVLNVLGMVVSALVESRRIHYYNSDDGRMMSFLWLFPQLIIVGVGESFHFPGQVELYYQEFPAAFKSSATTLMAMIIGISFYLSTAVIDVSRSLGWLKDDLNSGRLDLAYWMLAVVGVFNLGYFLICAVLCSFGTKTPMMDVKKKKKKKNILVQSRGSFPSKN